MSDVRLTDEEREPIAIAMQFLQAGDHVRFERIVEAVERIVAARVAAAEREALERAAQAIEARSDQLHAALTEAKRGMGIAASIVRGLMPRKGGE